MRDELDYGKVSQRYDYYSKERLNFSDNATSIMNKIKDGYVPNEADVFELLERDQKKIDDYRKFYNIRKNMEDTGKISEGDLKFLIESLDVDDKTSKIMYEGFKNNGLIKENKSSK